MTSNRLNDALTIHALSLSLALLVALAGCGDEHEHEHEHEHEDACEAEQDGWTRCADGQIQRCHAEAGGDAHYDQGRDCEAAGLSCVQASDSQAVCVDVTSECVEGARRCEENTAYNCVGGATSVEPCGTARTCVEDASSGQARCDGPEPEPID